jgi:hypothetical protein
VCLCLQDSATLQWSPPHDNGAPISCYTLEVDDGRGGEFRLAYSGAQCKAVVKQLQVRKAGRRLQNGVAICLMLQRIDFAMVTVQFGWRLVNTSQIGGKGY